MSILTTPSLPPPPVTSTVGAVEYPIPPLSRVIEESLGHKKLVEIHWIL